MKRVLLFTLLLFFITATVWATSGELESKLKGTVISADIQAKQLPLEELLDFLSEQSGIKIIAVPEIAQTRVDIQIKDHQTLDKVFEALSNTYNITYHYNAAKNAVIVMKGDYYRDYGGTLLPNVMLKSITEAESSSSRPIPKLNATVGGVPPLSSYHQYGNFNTEEYKGVTDNSYQDALSTPVSTFSIDVDTASYSNVRRFINNGKLPPVDAVRTEELINYFNYDYPQPVGDQPFSLTTEVHDCQWQPEHKFLMIGLKGQNIKSEELPPSNLVFLIDVSGSMEHPNKLPLLKSAFKILVKQLRKQDKVSIVVYAGAAGLVLEPTSGSEKSKIIDTIENLQAGGSTAGGEGIKLAYKIAKDQFVRSGNNRVILATDGDFNVGESSEGQLMRMVEERRNDGIFLTVLGFGMDNIKDNKMEVLADKGNGNYAYIDNALEAKKVLVNQFAGTLFTIAKDVKLQLEFNPAKVRSYRLIGYENRVLENRDFNDDKKDAGDMGADHVVTAFYEIIPADSKEQVNSVDPLVYQQSTLVPSEDLLQVKVRYKKPLESTSMLVAQTISSKDANESFTSDNFKFASSVAEYAMLLRNSEFKANASYQQVLSKARSAKGDDEDGYKAEFIKIVEISQLLDEKNN